MSRRGSEPPFELANQLTKRDNKALCISFASFVLGLGIITTGSLNGTDVQVSHPATTPWPLARLCAHVR